PTIRARLTRRAIAQPATTTAVPICTISSSRARRLARCCSHGTISPTTSRLCRTFAMRSRPAASPTALPKSVPHGKGATCRRFDLPHLIQEPLAFEEVEQRLLQECAVIARKLAAVGLHRTVIVRPAEAEETPAGLHP